MVALQALKKVREPLRQGGEAAGWSHLKQNWDLCTVCRNIDISRGVTSAPPHWILCHVSCSRVVWQDIDTISKQLQGKSKNTSLQKYRYQQAKLSSLYSTLCQPCAALTPWSANSELFVTLNCLPLHCRIFSVYLLKTNCFFSQQDTLPNCSSWSFWHQWAPTRQTFTVSCQDTCHGICNN